MADHHLQDMGTPQRREAALIEFRIARDEVRTIQLELEEAQAYLAEAAWAACGAGIPWHDLASALEDPAGASHHDLVRRG